jgi:cell wall-associated NlpC family hydrolase
MNLITSTLTLCVATLMVSCGALKPAAHLTQNANNAANTEKSGIHFLAVKEIISQPTKTILSSDYTEIESAPQKNTVDSEAGRNLFVSNGNTNTVGVSYIQTKYAEKLEVAAESLTNIPLYKSVDNWYGTRYRFGGMSHRGVDCSSLMQHLYQEAYGMTIPRTAITQYRATKRVTRDDLQEGDLVFFHTTRAGISHVGMYLGNDRFVHASSSKGVTINQLTESYYASRIRGYGRFEKNSSVDMGLGQ